MLYKIITVLISIFFLTSCASNAQTSSSDGIFSTEYVPARKERALAGAEKYCRSKNKDLKIVSTDCAWRCVSIFQCVADN